MDDLEWKIDRMIREKVVADIQETSVRVMNINVRFTKKNLKNSPEHLDAVISSFERLLRSVPKQIITVEKSVRVKYLVPMDEDRKIKMRKLLRTEVESIIEKMIKDYRELHALKNLASDFDQRIEKNRIKAKENIVTQMQKLEQAIAKEVGAPGRIPPSGLSEIYGIDESELIDLGLIAPLQNIHIIFDNLAKEAPLQKVFQSVREGIALSVEMLKRFESGMEGGLSVNDRKQHKMNVARESLVFKDVVLSINSLTEQIQTPPDQRNGAVLKKTWDSLEGALSGKPGSELVINKIRPLYEIFEK